MTFACYYVLQMHPDGGRAWVLSFFLLEQPVTLTDDGAETWVEIGVRLRHLAQEAKL